MSAVVEAPLASELVLLSLPSLPTERPGWADPDLSFDEREQDGTAAICWRRMVATEVGDLLVAQWVWGEDGTVYVTPACWDSKGFDFELTAGECQDMALAMLRIAAQVQVADRAAVALAGTMGDPWVTLAEGAERCGMKPWPLRELVDTGRVASVKVGRAIYVRAADLPGRVW